MKRTRIRGLGSPDWIDGGLRRGQQGCRKQQPVRWEGAQAKPSEESVSRRDHNRLHLLWLLEQIKGELKVSIRFSSLGAMGGFDQSRFGGTMGDLAWLEQLKRESEILLTSLFSLLLLPPLSFLPCSWKWQLDQGLRRQRGSRRPQGQGQGWRGWSLVYIQGLSKPINILRMMGTRVPGWKKPDILRWNWRYWLERWLQIDIGVTVGIHQKCV